MINKIDFGKKVTAYLIKNMVYSGRGVGLEVNSELLLISV